MRAINLKCQADSFNLLLKSLNFLKKSYASYQIKIEALYKKLFQLNNRNLHSYLVKWEVRIMI